MNGSASTRHLREGHDMLESRSTPVIGTITEVDIECSRPAGGREQFQLQAEEPLATVAHELRNPLSAILLAAEALPLGQHDDPVILEVRTIVIQQARRMVRIVEDLFEICAVSRGTLSLNKEVVDLATIVALATESTGHMLKQQQHRLTVTLPSEPVHLLADPLRLEQVLSNLLSNAAKFTAPGGDIWLTAEVRAAQVVLRVRDNGCGITPEFLPQVFDLYRRGQDLGDLRPAGLGLGLALVKSLVERHGGSVTAASEGQGAGAEFTICLPAWVRNA
ncbi:MAG: hypothetical protein JWM11_6668 [Planctomycetaceae bacterium]|nr:hypothetical protein [Planctomycetaceae bacterium]